MEPPPAPTVWMSITGTATAQPAISYSFVLSGWPGQRETSVLVPPMSKESTRSNPNRCAASRAATTPPAGPDKIVWTGSRAARSTEKAPPLEAMIRTRAAPLSRLSRSRYRRTSGAT